MKRFYLSVLTLLVLVVFGVGAQGGEEDAAAGATGGGAVATEPGSIEDFEYLLDPAALREFLADPPAGLFLVDVRTAEEYADGHIPTAIQIDYRGIGDDPPTTDKGALIVVYCRSGNRSNAAAVTLAELGYTNVLDWGRIGNWPYEVITGSNP